MLHPLLSKNPVFSSWTGFTVVPVRGQPGVICFLSELSCECVGQDQCTSVIYILSEQPQYFFFPCLWQIQIHWQGGSIPNSPSFEAEQCRCCFATSTSNGAVNSTLETDCKSTLSLQWTVAKRSGVALSARHLPAWKCDCCPKSTVLSWSWNIFLNVEIEQEYRVLFNSVARGSVWSSFSNIFNKWFQLKACVLPK